jgi:hypothetical protein
MSDKDPSYYLKLTTRLERGPELSEIFERHSDNGKIKDEWFLSELLQDLSEYYGVDFNRAGEYFSNSANEDDSADVIHMANFDEASFRRRLGNYCLTQACSLDPHSDQVPQQYIASYRTTVEDNKSTYTAEDPPDPPQVEEVQDEMQQTVEEIKQTEEETKQTVKETPLTVEETQLIVEETQLIVEAAQYTMEEAQLTDEVQLDPVDLAEEEAVEEEEFERAMEEAGLDLVEQIQEEAKQEPMTGEVKLTKAVQAKSPPDEQEEFWLDTPKPIRPTPPSIKRKGRQIKVKPLTYQVSEKPLSEEIMQRNSSVLHKDQTFDLTDDFYLDSAVKPGRPETWLTPYLQKHAGRVLEAFISQMTTSLDEVAREDIGKVFAEVFGVCGVPRTQIGSSIFQSLVAQEHIEYFSHLSFLNLMEDWAAKYSPEVTDVASKIRQTIAEYEAMMQAMGSDSNASIDLAAVIVTLKSQLNQHLTQVHKRPRVASSKDFLTKGLKDIFAFYARQQKVMGAPSTFDSISHNYSVWTLSKYFKFCKDFDLMGKHGQGTRRLDREELTAIFKKHAALAKLLSEENFLEMLERLAVAFYNSLYDQVSQSPPVQQLSPREKLSLLMKYLGCDNPEVYQMKMKGFAPAFSKEKTGYRIFEDDLSKRYQYRSDFQRPRYSTQIRKNSKATPEPSSDSSSKLDARPKLRNSPSPKKPESLALKVLSDRRAKEELDMIKALGIDESDWYEDVFQSVQDTSRASKLLQADDRKLGEMLKMHDHRVEKGLKAVERVRRQPLGYK